MAIDNYRDFVLFAEDIRRQGGDGIVNEFTIRVFESPAGEGEGKERVTVPDGLVQKIRWLESRSLDANVGEQIELGETLASLLLPGDARKLFGQSWARLCDVEGLRLRLRLADELADFPWEYLYIQDTRGERTPSSFLALNPRISIVRHETLSIPGDCFDVPGDWYEAPVKRRVVVAMATPPPHARYPELKHLPQEQKAIKQALGGIKGIDAVYLPDYTEEQYDPIPGASLEGVSAALMQRADIFHFSGHGEFVGGMGPAFGTKVGMGGIVLADAGGQALPVDADRLAEVLRGKGIRLVVLGACETGRRDGRNVWSGVAAALLKAGIPAVVAMQFTIRDSLAAAFCGALYQALIAGFAVDEAVARGRAAIRLKSLEGEEPHIRDWGVPVLYLRAPSGINISESRRDRRGLQDTPKPRHPLPGQAPFFMPFPRNRDFVGRTGDLENLHARLQQREHVGIRPAALTGMGGIGKTQLAVEYSYRQHEAGTYPDGIFWINAAEPLDQGFARLARDLGMARTDQALDQQVRSAFDALDRWEKALLVLDNLEDPGTLNRPIVSGCIPAGLSCRLLFTTRRRDLGRFTPVRSHCPAGRFRAPASASPSQPPAGDRPRRSQP